MDLATRAKHHNTTRSWVAGFSNFEVLFIVFTLAVACFTIFYKLGNAPIYIWDEAIYACNSLDMAKSGDLLVLKIDGVVNTYNSKPPLVNWLQALCVRIWGSTEFAIRLPSALAALGTCLILLVFSHRTLHNVIIGCISVLILATTFGFIRHHVSRTGDLDAVLVMWITFYSSTALHYFLMPDKGHRIYLSLITFGIVMAFLTKSVAGLLPLPGLLIVGILNKRIKDLIRIPFLYFCILIFLCVYFGFYFLREYASPGSLDTSFQSEYLRFFQNIMPWHEQPVYFYMTTLYARFIPYLFIFPFALYFAFRQKNMKPLTMALIIFILVYLVIISIPKVKLEWYDAPVYPFLCLILGMGIYNCLQSSYDPDKKIKFIIVLILISLLIIWGFINTVQRISHNNGMPVDPLEREGYFMKDLHKINPELNTYSVLMHVNHKAHLTQAQFYASAYNWYNAYNIKIVDDVASITPGQTYLFLPGYC